MLTPYGNDPGVGPLSPPRLTSSSFTVSQGCGHSFAPSLAAGAASSQAGAFSPLTIVFTRQDGEQRVNELQGTSPPGYTAVIAGVALLPRTPSLAGHLPGRLPDRACDRDRWPRTVAVDGPAAGGAGNRDLPDRAI